MKDTESLVTTNGGRAGQRSRGAARKRELRRPDHRSYRLAATFSDEELTELIKAIIYELVDKFQLQAVEGEEP